VQNVLEKNRRNNEQKSFLYSQGYRDQKWGKKRTKQFVLKHTNSAAKIVGEKSSRKSAKKTFFTFTRIS